MDMMTGHLQVPSSALADSLFTFADVRNGRDLLMCSAQSHQQIFGESHVGTA
jgi:hypothetical protein